MRQRRFKVAQSLWRSNTRTPQTGSCSITGEGGREIRQLQTGASGFGNTLLAVGSIASARGQFSVKPLYYILVQSPSLAVGTSSEDTITHGLYYQWSAQKAGRLNMRCPCLVCAGNTDDRGFVGRTDEVENLATAVSEISRRVVVLHFMLALHLVSEAANSGVSIPNRNCRMLGWND
jgi:hypothetical protein